MTRSSLTEVRALARALLDAESADQTVEARLRAAERVLSSLAERIQPLIGGEGFQMLLQRALNRARDAHPTLGDVRADRTAETHLLGMSAAGQIADPEEATAAAEAIVTELVGLLARFVGADMTIRLVRQSFPKVFPASTRAGAEEIHHE